MLQEHYNINKAYTTLSSLRSGWWRLDIDSWSEIFDALTKNKLRSLLTAFGIFWGVFMLILLMGGGQGLKTMLATNFAGFASNSGFVAPSTTSKPYHGFRNGRYWQLNTDDVERMRNTIPEIDLISAITNKHGVPATNNESTVDVSVLGITPAYQQVSNPMLRHGRKLTDADVAEARKVCVIGDRAAETLFPGGGNVCGKHVIVGGVGFTIVGVSGRGNNGVRMGGQAGNSVEMPLSTFQQLYGTGKRIDMICFTVKEGHTVGDVNKKIRPLVCRQHEIHPDDEQAVFLLNTEAMFNFMDSIFRGISLLVWMIGIGTILSGAIGVSNIMMVTVRERTTEIGIRRAIGATPTAIMKQILSESMVLTLTAGLSGITFAVLILALVEQAARTSMSGDESISFLISFWTAIGSALFLALLGLASGITPALRAMQIKPVEAMRSDE